jgi:hypothetical protein
LNKAPDAVILTLLVTYTDATKILDREGYLPLHKAIELKFSDKVILALLNANKEATTNMRNGLPLHKAIANNYSENVVIALLEANKNAVNMVDNYNALPLH